MNTIHIGTSAYPNADTHLLLEAGITWIRQDFSFPFVDQMGGVVSVAYQEEKTNARNWTAKGFQVMGVTPLIGIGLQEADPTGRLQTVWKDFVPPFMGKPGSLEFQQNYQELSTFLAQDLKGIVSGWQILNELDIPIFAGPLNPRQAGDLILASARALKTIDPGLIVGYNTAGSEKAYFLYGYLHSDSSLLDYCGVDGYYGTWSPGGPENWSTRIAELYALTGVKILVNEWGFASAGGSLSEVERQSNPYVCQYKKWYHTWNDGHTPQVQALFVEKAFESFHQQREKLFGAFFYRWEDQQTCWQCGQPDCPAETAWGLVTVDNQPKPSYQAFRKGVHRLLENNLTIS